MITIAAPDGRPLTFAPLADGPALSLARLWLQLSATPGGAPFPPTFYELLSAGLVGDPPLDLAEHIRAMLDPAHPDQALSDPALVVRVALIGHARPMLHLTLFLIGLPPEVVRHYAAPAPTGQVQAA